MADPQLCKHGLLPKSCPHCWRERERPPSKSYVILTEKGDYDGSDKLSGNAPFLKGKR